MKSSVLLNLDTIEELFLPVELVTSKRFIFIPKIAFYMIQGNELHCNIFAMKLRFENLGLTALTQLRLQFWLEVAFVTSKT